MDNKDWPEYICVFPLGVRSDQKTWSLGIVIIIIIIIPLNRWLNDAVHSCFVHFESDAASGDGGDDDGGSG